MLEELPSECNVGAKNNSRGYEESNGLRAISKGHSMPKNRTRDRVGEDDGAAIIAAVERLPAALAVSISRIGVNTLYPSALLGSKTDYSAAVFTMRTRL